MTVHEAVPPRISGPYDGIHRTSRPSRSAASASTLPANRIPWPPNPAKIVDRSILTPPPSSTASTAGAGIVTAIPFARSTIRPDGVRGHDLGLQPLHRGRRRHAPAHRAGGQDLHDAEAVALLLDLERPADRRLRLAHEARVRHGHPCGVGDAREQRQQLGHGQRVAGRGGVAPERAGRGLLAGQRGRGHLAAGHAVDPVVHEDRREPFAAGGGVDDLGGADGGEVPVALVREHDPVRADALDARGDGRRPTVRRLDRIEPQVVVGEHRAARPNRRGSSALRGPSPRGPPPRAGGRCRARSPGSSWSGW